MKLRYIALSFVLLGILACESPRKEEAPKKEEKTEVPKQETEKQEQVGVALAGEDIEKGKNLFTSKGCNACHQPAVDTVGPSLKTIAKYYNTPEELVKFLKGEADPKVWPEKFAQMKPQLAILKPLSEGELKAIASYILSHK